MKPWKKCWRVSFLHSEEAGHPWELTIRFHCFRSSQIYSLLELHNGRGKATWAGSNCSTRYFRWPEHIISQWVGKKKRERKKERDYVFPMNYFPNCRKWRAWRRHWLFVLFSDDKYCLVNCPYRWVPLPANECKACGYLSISD